MSETILRTYKGSKIARDPRYGVGKRMGNKVYFHKMYAFEIVPDEVLMSAVLTLHKYHNGFKYNCIRYDTKTQEVCFQQASVFDYQEEPIVGHYIAVQDGEIIKNGFSRAIWHHKWLWVKDDYTGFNVQSSKDWSAIWLSKVCQTANGSSTQSWVMQLYKWGVFN